MVKKRFPKRINVNDISNACSYTYIQVKAKRFLDVGYMEYTKDDFFHQPGENLTTGELSLLTSGCEQIADDRGLTIENPFEGLGIKGFYSLMRMFHFRSIQQEANFTDDDFIIDKITFQHRVTGEMQQIVLFNKVIKKRNEVQNNH